MDSVSCICGRRAVLFTSWTDLNPGRRFVRCASYGRGGCHFWEWVDPPMCERSRVIIPGLLRKATMAEDELKILGRKNKLLFTLLLASGVLMLWVYASS